MQRIAVPGLRDRSMAAWLRSANFLFLSQSTAALLLVCGAAILSRGALADVWLYPGAPALLYGGAALAGYAVAALPLRVLVVGVLLSASYVSASWAWSCLFAQTLLDLVAGFLAPLAVLAMAGLGVYVRAASRGATCPKS
jgi:NADH:ubiquinone oxidoreductase subunit F (NADH-binding)